MFSLKIDVFSGETKRSNRMRFLLFKETDPNCLV